MSKQETYNLPIHEWLAMLVLVAIVFSLTMLSHVKAQSIVDEKSLCLGAPQHIVSQVLEVRIEGHVKNPGSYKLTKGQQVKDLLLLAEPLPEANLSKIKPESKLRKGQVVTIPQRKVRSK